MCSLEKALGGERDHIEERGGQIMWKIGGQIMWKIGGQNFREETQNN